MAMAKPKSPTKRVKESAAPKPTTSPYCEPQGSAIHQQGLFASKKIPKNAEIIEYVGEKISTKEGDRRAIDLADEREGTGDASVYMFILDDDHDVDGNVPHNTAKLINHGCDPNCEAQIIDDEIWIVALKEIKKGDELTFDYGFELDHYEDHPCRCGSPKCIGYIVSRDYWPKLQAKLAKKKAAAKKKATIKKKKATIKKKAAKKQVASKKKKAAKKNRKKKR
jgi:SET domain-containing protein